MVKLDQTLLDKSPLSNYEKNLIMLIDVQGGSVTDVAKELKKHKATISVQHKGALEQLDKWSKDQQGNGSSYGVVAGQAFELFEKGKKPIDVVIELRQLPEIVDDLFAQWAKMRGGLYILRATREKIRSKAWSEGWNEGKEDVRKNEANFRVPCSKCQKPMYFSSKDAGWEKEQKILLCSI